MNRILSSGAFVCASILLVTLFAAPAAAQEPPSVAPGGHGERAARSHGPGADPFLLAEQREAMARLAGWVGEWRGSGWAAMRDGRGRSESTVHESVQSKLGGLALLVEGRGTTLHPETGEEKLTHDALGVVTYDPHGDRYLFRYYSAEGQSGEAELVPIEGGWRWGFTAPGGGTEVRFTIELGEDTWHERGEVSMDGGEKWFPMLEMTLRRQVD